LRASPNASAALLKSRALSVPPELEPPRERC